MLSPKNPVLLSAVLLGMFGVLGSSLVALTHMGTAEKIAANEKATLMREINKLVPVETTDNDLLKDHITVKATELGRSSVTVYRARMQGKPVAVVLSPIEAPGYASPIHLIVAILENGTLGGVRVLRHQETPGLGDKIEESRHDWILGFSGKSLGNPAPERWRVKRDGGDFDQFTGATITPRAIVTAVKKALEYYAQHKDAMIAEQTVQVDKTHEQ